MSSKKKRRPLAEAQTGKQQQPSSPQPKSSRRDFLRYATGLITAAGLAGGGLYYYFSDKEESQPIPEGPVNIGAKEQIIPKRYPERQKSHLEIDEEEKRKILPFLVAVSNGRDDLVENFFTKSSREAYAAVAEIDPSLENFKDQFLSAFPDSFSMSGNVKRGVLPIFIAIGRKRGMDNDTMLNMADVLIRNGADPLAILNDPTLPFPVVKSVLDIMPRYDDPAHFQLFHALIDSRYFPEGWEKIQYAIEKGVDVNQTPKPPAQNLGTALHIVIANESFDDAVRLIAMMGDRYNPNIKDAENKTALIIAAKMMGTKVVKSLIKQYDKKLEIDAQDKDGRTALHYACAYGLSDMAEALVNAGARRDIKDRDNRTPEDLLRLTPPQLRDMLASIEISADRDIGATWNAVLTSDRVPFADKSGKAILATKQNIEALGGELSAAIERRGEATGNREREQKDLDILQQQKDAMTGVSIMNKILAGRKEVQALLDRTAGRTP